MKVKDLVNLHYGDIRIDIEVEPRLWDYQFNKKDCIVEYGDAEVEQFCVDIETNEAGYP
ncbi:hypothetical protein RV08_GL002658 [Enterococcus mundtii]|uniref:Uncharacterized protein n=1 Tax=Enterococcus mundtii TaxID=53346 RepID=A0ABQ0VCC3_ENTMU|nr:hypothetical protein [Enterococcus mundtii]OJG56451.1 hypothetical protein RV08_GL002658 [Enterococcus mundtii]GEL80070.1 hypothetical protein EMU01_12140 [Enterococcus mundtii]GEN18150.1 hypothetical protein LAC02_14310 [Ligilactobacillus acidipiscis]